MTKTFKAQLLQELEQAGYREAVESPGGDAILPAPQYPELQIRQGEVLYSAFASDAEKDFARRMAGIRARTEEACDALENSRAFPENCTAGEGFNRVSEYGDIVLAVRDDGMHGLHFVTWQYNREHTAVEHGHYTTSFAGAKEDFALRAGLVNDHQVLRPEDAPMVYRALQALEDEGLPLTRDQEDQLDEIRRQLRWLEPDVAQQAAALAQAPPIMMEPELSM